MVSYCHLVAVTRLILFQRCVNGLVNNTGQIWFAASRVYVQEGIYDRFLAAYQEAFTAKRELIGDPEKGSSQIGPIVDQSQYDRILVLISKAKTDKQGTLLQGGQPFNPPV